MKRIGRLLPLIWLATLGLSRVWADEEPVADPPCSPSIIHELDVKSDGSAFLVVLVKIAGERFTAMIDTGSTWTT